MNSYWELYKGQSCDAKGKIWFFWKILEKNVEGFRSLGNYRKKVRKWLKI